MSHFDVFLCHNSEDKQEVKLIADKLKNQSLYVWLDESELRPGTPWQLALGEAIDNINAAAVFIGTNGIGPWQQLEQEYLIRKFIDGGRPVIPVILPNCKNNPELPWFLSGLIWVDFRKSKPDPIDQLIWGVKGYEKPSMLPKGKKYKANTVVRDYYFGYFYTEVEGRERLLVGVDNKDHLCFPISGFRSPSRSIQQAIDVAVANFVRRPALQATPLLSVISTSTISDLSASRSFLPMLHHGADVTKIRPFFFKVHLTDEVDLRRTDYIWIEKNKFLASKQIGKKAIKATDFLTEESQELAQMVTRDRIQAELGRRVLECVDILVFREKKGSYEFLMLRRDKEGEKFGGWEYPKGGLEYHETTHEGAIRELLEETGLGATGGFRYGGYLGSQIADVSWREHSEYDTLHVHGVTYLFYGRDGDIQLDAWNEGHKEFAWMPLEKAREKIWVGDYGPKFFDLWNEKRWQIIRRIARPISLAFQVSEECPLGCRFCLRRQADEKDLSTKERKEIVDILAERGILRLTITGGEPLITKKKKQDVFKLLEYAHAKRIHTCLSTTGVTLEKSDFNDLENYLDQLLLSIHSVTDSLADGLYEKSQIWAKLLSKAENILEWTIDSKIIIEISTVVSKLNIDYLVELGDWIFTKRTDVFWRLDEYYGNGDQDAMRPTFELTSEEFGRVETELTRRFSKQHKNGRLRFSRKESREKAPDIMITPQGRLVTSAGHGYTLKGDKQDLLFYDLKNRRNWSEYRDCIRTDWNW